MIIIGFGPDGPYATRPGYDVIAEAIGGFMHVNAPVDGPPQHAGVAVIDMITGTVFLSDTVEKQRSQAQILLSYTFEIYKILGGTVIMV